MICNPNILIEKFATLIEKGQHLNTEELTQRTLELIFLLSQDSSLNEMITAINNKIRSILARADELEMNGIATLENAHQYIADQLRTLKIQSH